MTRRILLYLLLILLISCSKDNNDDPHDDPNNDPTLPTTYSFSGKAQKGPFISGTSIIINELNESLGQTGRSFTSKTISDDGSFNVNNIELNSNFVLFTATGYYFNEIYGELSPGMLSLRALSDLTNRETVNINVLTHLISDRIQHLVSNGSTFSESYDQAKSELLEFLGAPELSDKDFEDYDISEDNEYNALLLSFSVILHRLEGNLAIIPTMTGELTQLLSKFSQDFSTDGLIDNRDIIDTLLYNMSILNLSYVRMNIEERYASLGISAEIPDFEHYMSVFQLKHDPDIVFDYFYPDSAMVTTINPEYRPKNLLPFNDTVFSEGQYCLAAVIPKDSTLRIKFISDDQYEQHMFNMGWDFINNQPQGFELLSLRENQLMSVLVNLYYSGSARIEYYYNESLTPNFIKTVHWFAD